MLTDVYEPLFQNWIKGVLGIRKTRSVICDFVTEKMENEIRSMSEGEKRHLPIFIKCLNENNVEHLKTVEKVRRRSWKCNHSTCETLMDRMIELHASPIKDECKWTFDTGLHSRSSLLSRADATEMSKENVKEVVWAMIQLFMYGEKAKQSEKCKSLDGLDFSKIVKMMRNCSLFRFEHSERLYENVIDVRNELMHSADNQLSDEKVHEIIGQLKEFLKHLNETETTSCKNGLKYLQQLDEKGSFGKELANSLLDIKKAVLDLNTSLGNSTDEIKSKTKVIEQLLEEEIKRMIQADSTAYRDLVKSTLEIKKEALDTDIQTFESSGESSKELQVLRRETTKTLEHLNESKPEPDIVGLDNNRSKRDQIMKSASYEYKTENKTFYEDSEQQKLSHTEISLHTDHGEHIEDSKQSKADGDEADIQLTSDEEETYLNTLETEEEFLVEYLEHSNTDGYETDDELESYSEEIHLDTFKIEEDHRHQLSIPIPIDLSRKFEPVEEDNVTANDNLFSDLGNTASKLPRNPNPFDFVSVIENSADRAYLDTKSMATILEELKKTRYVGGYRADDELSD